jgi:hypothetical protein
VNWPLALSGAVTARVGCLHLGLHLRFGAVGPGNGFNLRRPGRWSCTHSQVLERPVLPVFGSCWLKALLAYRIQSHPCSKYSKLS